MEFLIKVYDNGLIFYPNIFIPLLFTLGVLVVLLIFFLVLVLGKRVIKKTRVVFKEVQRELRKKRITRKKIKKSDIARRLSPVSEAILRLNATTISFVAATIISTKRTITLTELYIKTILKKIEKEVLIEEKRKKI